MAKQDLTTSNSTFENLIKGNFLYVDKTEYLWQLLRPYQAQYFLSRPRRFGKSLTLSTFEAIFKGKKELFQGLAIYGKPYDWKPYPVIRLNMNGWDYSTLEYLERSLCGVIQEQAAKHGLTVQQDNPTAMFRSLVNRLAVNGPVVVLVDEYDKPILDNMTAPIAKDVLQRLKSFYSVIKEKEEVIRFAFVTGITKFCHVSLFSDLNNLIDISMEEPYATMLGYTQEELEANFGEWIADTESRQELPHTEFLAKIREWYDGFRFLENAESVYNPVSVATFFRNGGKFCNYWFKTGTPAFLIELVQKKDFNFSSLLSEPVPSMVFDAFEIDDIDPATLLIQTGYLTIRGTELQFGQLKYWLDFPNREVSEAFNTRLLNAYAARPDREVKSFCDVLTKEVCTGNLPKFQKLMEAFFAGIPYDVHHKSEANFQNIFFILFKMLGFNVHAEMRTSDGRIDAVIETGSYVYLFEFKLDRDDSALSQIKEKEYFKPYLLSPKKILLVGVNFDTETGRLSGWQDEEVPAVEEH